MKQMLLSLVSIALIILTCNCIAQPIKLDSTFHAIGYNLYEFDGYATGRCMAFQPDGKIVMTGFVSSSDSGGYLVLIMRLNPDGTLDGSFDNDGFVKVETPNVSAYAGSSVVIQPDGKILTTGMHHNGDNKDFTLMRFNADGSFDSSFGNGGYFILDLGSTEVADVITLLENDKIVASGTAFGDGTNLTYTIVVQLNSNGTVDNTFGDNGLSKIYDFYQDDNNHSLVTTADGKIIIAGLTEMFATTDDDTDIRLVRLNENGFYDQTFGMSGISVADFYEGLESIHAIQQLPGGELLTLIGGCGDTHEVTLYKFKSDGTLDDSWGIDGRLAENVNDVGFGVINFIVKPDGKILLCGEDNANMSDFCIVQLNADGSVDSDFGLNGHYSTDLTNGKIDVAKDLLLQPDGKIVVGGTSHIVVDGQFAVARYMAGLATGIMDPAVVATNLIAYPDPVTSFVTLNYSSDGNFPVSICMTSIEGKVVETFIDSKFPGKGNHTETFSLSPELAAGIYFIVIKNGSSQRSVKVIK